jgi:hypothetical protein
MAMLTAGPGVGGVCMCQTVWITHLEENGIYTLKHSYIQMNSSVGKSKSLELSYDPGSRCEK